MTNKKLGRLSYWLSGLYLIFLLILLGFAFLGTPDALSGLGLVIATLPWSYLAGILFESSSLSDWGGGGSAVSASAFFILLGIPNAVVLYLLGVLIDRVRFRDPKVR